ncbi:DHH family phosphoesterase [Colwellia demingiae]|uniref:DHH family phosphoesterase n=1 Tax=Colwellia demingiae TaxID=89401 RepID=A0A5C6QTE5_9GAMM|nr:DHH family phosphoesterase [Colwellia demingiae]TWX71871.1 DHH family phosphoesterase [Colwellia demingiae]
MHYDVFNGDADGIIALLQLRLATPKDSLLITGVKRDIGLLKQVDVNKATAVTVLDISLEKNNQALQALINNQVDVFYVDHHRTGDIPKSNKLTTLLNTDANTCTSLLVNDLLKGQYSYWAIAAAFGDNMHASASDLAQKVGLSERQKDQLNELGTYINYNGYGQELSDLHFHPAALYQSLLEYPDPFVLINQENSIFSQLKAAYLADMAKARTADVLSDNDIVKTIVLEDAAWSRRVSGVFGNDLANQAPDKAHIVITLNPIEVDLQSKNKIQNEQSYTLSLRAPLNNKQGAGDICAQFPTGGGRAAAAGVNALPKGRLVEFIKQVESYYRH